MIQEPPTLPSLASLPTEVQNYFKKLDSWARGVYQTLSKMDIGTIKINSGESSPTGGEDGDVYIQIDGVNTKLYLNINGSFSAFNNP